MLLTIYFISSNISEKLYEIYVGLSIKQNSIIGGNVELQLGHFTESSSWEYILPITYSLQTRQYLIDPKQYSIQYNS
jgi:hypothetical protein